MSTKISNSEPADRPLTVALSHAELVALIRYHSREAQRIPKALGKAALELQAKSIFPSGRALKELHNEARKLIEAHALRARGLMSILEATKK